MPAERPKCSLQDIDQDQARLEDLLENIDDLVALATIDGRLLYVNRAWREKLGYAHSDIAQLSAYQVIDPEHEDEIKRTNARLAAGETVRDLKRTFVTKDGRRIRVEGSISCRFKDGKPYYLRAIFHDITEREKIERMKDELLAIANHEMRSPLMAILTSLELLRKDVAGAEDKTRRVVDLALRNSQRLLSLVNAYLDIEKIESGGAPFILRPVEIAPLLERAVEVNRPLGERVGVGMEVRPGGAEAFVYADEDRLTQVLTNLLSNAARFSKQGTTVSVSAARQGGRVRVAVADRGEGIPEEFRPKIFGRFCQAEGQKRGGSGLGLAISKAIVERLGGAIGFDTSAGEGTTFWFELPEVAAR